MSVTLIVKDTNVAPYLAPNTLNLSDAINARSVLGFDLIAPKNTLTIASGMPVSMADISVDEDYRYIFEAIFETDDYGLITEIATELIDDGVTEFLFGGTVDSVRETRISAGAGYNKYSVTCADHHKILDRRRVKKAYINRTVAYIINDILTDDLAGEGIVLAALQGGEVVVTEAVFNYEPASKVFKRLADKLGANWWLDSYKRLFFVERTTENAPWSLTETAQVKDVVVHSHRQNYRNKQIIIDGRAETDTQTESFSADGQQKTFSVAFPINQVPTVTVNSVSKTVGIRGVDEGKDFYWNKGDKEISAENAPSLGAVVAVSYVGVFDIVMVAQNDEEIAAQAAIEGGTGLYEAVASKRGLNTLDALSEIAVEELRKYEEMGRKITFNTRRSGLVAGQIIPVDLPEHDLNGDLLITSVSFQESGTPDKYIFNVQAVSGEAVGGWVDFFSKILTPDNSITLAEAKDTVTTVVTFSKTWLETDTPINPFRELFPSVTLFPSGTLYPVFADGEQVRHISWETTGGEQGRRYRVSQIRTATNIKTTFLLFTDVIDDITALGFYGGDLSTLSVGSGTELETVAYLKEKTRLDILQVTRIDTKGW